MSTRVFVDTNVFVYFFDSADPDKQRCAQRVIDERRRDVVVSTQVLLEVHSACTRKLGLNRAEAAAVMGSVAKFPVVEADRELMLSAARLAESARLSIFDAAIIVAAKRAECATILSEDLNSEQDYNGVRIENPFAG